MAREYSGKTHIREIRELHCTLHRDTQDGLALALALAFVVTTMAFGNCGIWGSMILGQVPTLQKLKTPLSSFLLDPGCLGICKTIVKSKMGILSSTLNVLNIVMQYERIQLLIDNLTLSSIRIQISLF